VNVLLVPAHPGFPGQIPQSRKTVVCVCVCVCFQDFPGSVQTLIYSIQFKFWSPQLHQHLCLHSTCHLKTKLIHYGNSRFALSPISTLVHPVPVTGFMQPLQTNDFITLYMLPFIPLHFLCTHFRQLVQCIELLPILLPQTLLRIIKLIVNISQRN